MKNLFDGNFYHLCTEGLEAEVIVRDNEDFRVACNYIALAAWRTRVFIVAFCVMSNHFHILSACKNRDMAEKLRPARPRQPGDGHSRRPRGKRRAPGRSLRYRAGAERKVHGSRQERSPGRNKNHGGGMAGIESAMREAREIVESSAVKVYGYGPFHDAITIAIDGYEKALIQALGTQKGA